jgi:hypothetical protein
MMLIMITSVGNSQTFQFGIQSGYNSTHFNIKGTSFEDMRNERKWSFGHNYGASVAMVNSGGYYQKLQRGVKLEWNRSYHSQNISVYPETVASGKFWKGRYDAVFSDIAILYTQNPAHHQAVFIEVGPVISSLIRKNNTVTFNSSSYEVDLEQTRYEFISIGGMIRGGLYYNFDKNLAVSFTVQGGKNFTPLTVDREYGRFWGGVNCTLIYKIKQ